MGRQLFRTGFKHRLIASNSDEVVGVMPIPKGGMLANVWGQVDLVATINKDRDFAAMYALDAYIIPYDDNTRSIDVDTLWDQEVTKARVLSVTAGAINFDDTPETAESDPAFEPGLPDVSRIWDMGVVAQRIYHREKFLTVASRGLYEPVAASESDVWCPNDSVRIRIKQNFKVEGMSYLLFAVSSPEIDVETTANETTLDAGAEVMYQNIELAIELAMPMIVGMTEAGAESPFDILAQLIGELTEPALESETAGAFATTAWNVWSKFSYEVQLGAKSSVGPIAS